MKPSAILLAMLPAALAMPFADSAAAGDSAVAARDGPSKGGDWKPDPPKDGGWKPDPPHKGYGKYGKYGKYSTYGTYPKLPSYGKYGSYGHYKRAAAVEAAVRDLLAGYDGAAVEEEQEE
ncbi:hypothetical protein B0T24DRAFT_618718 [Lasiosphaeria ovina]|uniref:Uncharacterized protein n=1 Tax=Lasiosphaeria ovina TaxID=92902 RepID=A0AAE0NA51_9PEZI|nr:hypothetical protein B0T24DRAFT_618718 [Lasiosphaeria ovina]